MMNMEGFTKFENFMTTGLEVLVLGRGHISYIVKMHYFLIKVVFFTRRQDKLSMYIVIVTKENSTKIVNFMTS